MREPRRSSWATWAAAALVTTLLPGGASAASTSSTLTTTTKRVTTTGKNFQGWYTAGSLTTALNCAPSESFVTSGAFAACCATAQTGRCTIGTGCNGATIFYDTDPQTLTW